MKTRGSIMRNKIANFAVGVATYCESNVRSDFQKNIGLQIIRSSTSAFLNHAEADAPESGRDFVHKLKLCDKEIRETRNALYLLMIKEDSPNEDMLNALLLDADELCAMIYSSIRTAKRNIAARNPRK